MLRKKDKNYLKGDGILELTLVYRGCLKPNGNKKSKQCIRRFIHKQLKQFFQEDPISRYWLPDSHDEKENTGEIIDSSIIQQVEGFSFAPLVTQQLNLIAELDITMLRPESPGSIVTKGGDIDNRIKTLLDSLRMPKVAAELPSNDSPKEDENPFFCLLEDDNLITKIRVSTDRLLEPCNDSKFVQLLIHVKIKPTRLTFDNLGFS
jgi:hypothetical protein